MYEVLDGTAAQVILAIERGDSIRRVAQHPHTPYETVRQAVNRLEDAGYVHYDGDLSVVDDRCATQRASWSELTMVDRIYKDWSLGVAYRETERVR